MTRKPYIAPTLAVYGAVTELTRAATSANADTPGGNDGTAFSP